MTLSEQALYWLAYRRANGLSAPPIGPLPESPALNR